MNGRISTGALATTLARLLVSLSLALTAMASMPPAFSFASTGGETVLTVQRSTDSGAPSNDEKQRDDDQARATVTSGKEKSGGGSLAKTGDDTPLVPPALVAAGAGLSILGIATRMWATRRRPKHLREDEPGMAGDGAATSPKTT